MQTSVSNEVLPAASCGEQPESYSEVLRGCRFVEEVGAALRVRVVDALDRVIGVGTSRERACMLAIRSRKGEMLPPEHYHPVLAGCCFSVEARAGVAQRVVLDKQRQVLGVGVGKLEAARAASRVLLARFAPADLTSEEFAQICTVITVETARGKSGKASTGEPYLRIDTRAIDDSNGRLRAAVARELNATGEGATAYTGGWGVLTRDTRFASGVDARVDELMRSEVFEGLVHHVTLANGEHIVMRRYDAPNARLCVEHVYRTLWELSKADRQDAGQRRTTARIESSMAA